MQITGAFQFFEKADAGETVLNALIVMAITFAALILLYGLVRLFSAVLKPFNKKASAKAGTAAPVAEQNAGGGLSAESGTLILTDTDEETAAMIMAIVSDKTGIPPERLVFRSIKLIK